MLGSRLGGGPNDQAVFGRLHAIEDVAQSLPLVVGQPLGDAVRLGVGNEDHESSRQRHFLGEASTLDTDGVLGDLTDDQLLGPQDLLDARLAIDDVFGVVLHVAAVQHRVLGRGDVDEGRLHTGEHVLDLAHVDVAVDLGDVVGWPAHVVLDETATLEHGHLSEVWAHLNAHEVTPDGATVALSSATAFLNVDIGSRTAPLAPRPFAAPSATASATPLLLGPLASSRWCSTRIGPRPVGRLAGALATGHGDRRFRSRTGVADLRTLNDRGRTGLRARATFGNTLGEFVGVHRLCPSSRRLA